MRVTNLVLLSFMIFVFACSSTKIIKNTDNDSERFKEFNYLAQNRTGNIVLNTGEVIITDFISLDNSVIKYQCSNCDSVKSISSEKVKVIYFKDHLVGGFRGAILGAVGGLILGLSTLDNDADMVGYTYVYFLAGGAVVGSITGSIIGSKIKYKIQY